jgi:predicted RNase H-like nuclease (RuvC/YqgF family)
LLNIIIFWVDKHATSLSNDNTKLTEQINQKTAEQIKIVNRDRNKINILNQKITELESKNSSFETELNKIRSFGCFAENGDFVKN